MLDCDSEKLFTCTAGIPEEGRYLFNSFVICLARNEMNFFIPFLRVVDEFVGTFNMQHIGLPFTSENF